MQTDCNQFEENKLKLISTPCHSHNFSEQPKQILTVKCYIIGDSTETKMRVEEYSAKLF